MQKVKVIHVDEDTIVFQGDVKLYSNHVQDCCESHYLSFKDLTMSDFEGLEFDITTDSFFNRVDGYGIELLPVNGHPVRVPGYGSNNGYYSSNLDLILTDNKTINRTFDISECQVIDG